MNKNESNAEPGKIRMLTEEETEKVSGGTYVIEPDNVSHMLEPNLNS